MRWFLGAKQKLQQDPGQRKLSRGLGARWDVPSSLTSSWGRRLMRMRSAFSLSCLLSMRARRSLEALSW